MSGQICRTPLPSAFYNRPVLEVARDMLGCVLRLGESAGIIVETEAYHESEAACHAHIGRTPRTSVLMSDPGTAYVYLSYGVHALVNAVCEADGIGAAVLIRALEPVEGLESMRRRRGVAQDRLLCSGPGRLTEALGIGLGFNGTSLVEGPLHVLDRPAGWVFPGLLEGPRIGITKAAELPWRFGVAGSRYLSRPMRAST